MDYNTINDAQTIAGNGEGTILANRYRVVRQLGQGGMGSVWLAEDVQLDNKPFAIKMLPAILVANKRAYRQLKDEALVAMRLVHPNIVQIRAFEENNGNPFLVMDYIDGLTLDNYLAEKGTLSKDETIRVLRPIAAALDYAHEKGVVHRDVKPGNVMVAKDGTPYILDFGIAREIQETMTRVTGKLSSGTLLYMSPEQLRGQTPKAAQDVYSFAAMAYECLKGEPPFVRGQIEFQILNEQPEPLTANGLTGKAAILAAGVMQGLSKKPEDRPPTCSEVLEGKVFSRVEHVERVESGGARVPRARSAESQPSAIGRTRSSSLPPRQEEGNLSHKENKEHKEAGRGVPCPPQGGAWKVLLGVAILGLIIAGGRSILVPTKQAPTKQAPTKQTPTKQTPTKQVPTKQAPTKQVTLSQGKVQLWEGGPYWADRNIGAEKPWEYGYYFWWGDVVGYTHKNGAWVASDGSASNFSFSEKNIPTYGKDTVALKSKGWITADGVLAPAHDAAQVQWEKGWRMPTRRELDDLCNKCAWTWAKMNGVDGYVVRGKGDYASVSIFLPAAGYGYGTSLYSAGSDGFYWSSVPDSDLNDYSWRLYFISGYHDAFNSDRGVGQSVRPVQGFTK